MLDYHFRLTISLLQTIGTEKKSVTINFSFTFNRETWRNRNMVADTKVINAFENDIGWRRRNETEDRFEGNRAPDLDRHPPISRSPIGVFLIEGAKRRMAMFPRLSISAMRGLSPRFVSKILLTYNSFPPNILNTSIHARD